MAWLKRAWAGWLGVIVPWLVILGLVFLALPVVWWAVDQTGALDMRWACGDMEDRAEAQEYLDRETEHNDRGSMKNLDPDRDGKACETHVFDAVASEDQDSVGSDCDPSYPDTCLDPDAVDYDCQSGDGNGPRYVNGPIKVRGYDTFGLDADGDGWGCDWG